MYNIILALALALLAGLCTAIGGIIAVTTRRSDKMLAVSVSFAIGVMLYVALADILPQAQQLLEGRGWIMVLCYCIGIALISSVERLVPEPQHTLQYGGDSKIGYAGVSTAVAIAVHNIPEGMATFVLATEGISVALPMVVAIALHNIPEGMAVSAPIYYATNSKPTALLYSLWCGLAEPVGALLACWVLLSYLTPTVLAICYAIVAGIMTYVSVDMLPTAYSYNSRLSTIGIICGMIAMAISIAILP